jgi:exo-beta-1,3-glucanase (GH17 family)/cellulose synthase/poly-beta-1,6-N-acetylglucosamine synthase-like glycosyltransferase
VDKSILLVGGIVAAIVLAAWTIISFPQKVASYSQPIQGISFSPFRPGNDPNNNRWPTREQISEDLELLWGKVNSLRTYSVQNTLGDIPRLAREFGFSVTLGAWITDDPKWNEREIERVIRIANENRNVKRILVGNEALLRKEITVDELIKYIGRVRSAVHVPVSTAEPWHVWLVERKLAHHVDFIAIQLLPWWEGVPLKDATEFVLARFKDVQRVFPKRKVIISEVGWPSNGLARLAVQNRQDREAKRIGKALGAAGVSTAKPSLLTSMLNPAVPSPANQAKFVRSFLNRAGEAGLDYYLLEAFDQPWKSDFEGAIGSYWGIYDAERKPKFQFAGAVPKIFNWHVLAGFSVFLALLIYRIFMLDSRRLSLQGRCFLAGVACLMAFSAGWILHYYFNLYFSVFSTVAAICVAAGFSGIVMLVMVETHEMAEASWRTKPTPSPRPGHPHERLPKFSIHVPAYNEPPEMMIDTLNALARLDYPDFEVLVIDNNTKDPAVWKPVRAECESLGSRFTFFHVDPLSGFKAGALNYVLERTSEDAEIVAVIDSDYQVDSNWLKDLVPHFRDPRIACVQAPQDYVPDETDIFKTMCLAEYRGFFEIGMVTRNERNAIIQHGTMTMVRKTALHEVGGWGEWCITEDAELGLRLMEHGYKLHYTPRSYGRGILPDRFIDYRKQRFRWAYGSIQIMKRHARDLFAPKPTRLTLGQRYHFLAGWFPWIADGVNLIWTIIAVAWSMAMLVNPTYFGPPSIAVVVPIFGIFAFKVFKTFYLYRVRMGVSLKRTLGAIVAGIALSHTVARAVIQGFRTSDTPFFRTPKCENKPMLMQAFSAASEETFLMISLWIAAVSVAISLGIQFPAAMVWSCLLFVQSLPYLAAALTALCNSTRPELEKKAPVPVTVPQE